MKWPILIVVVLLLGGVAWIIQRRRARTATRMRPAEGKRVVVESRGAEGVITQMLRDPGEGGYGSYFTVEFDDGSCADLHDFEVEVLPI